MTIECDSTGLRGKTEVQEIEGNNPFFLFTASCRMIEWGADVPDVLRIHRLWVILEGALAQCLIN